MLLAIHKYGLTVIVSFLIRTVDGLYLLYSKESSNLLRMIHCLCTCILLQDFRSLYATLIGGQKCDMQMMPLLVACD